MSRSVMCPSCGTQGMLPPGYALDKVRCPNCARTFEIAAHSTEPTPAALSGPGDSEEPGGELEPQAVGAPSGHGRRWWIAGLAIFGSLGLSVTMLLAAWVLLTRNRVEPARNDLEGFRVEVAEADVAIAEPERDGHDPAAVRDRGSGPLALDEIIARRDGSVALIKGQWSSGTGFLVAEGVLATNAHVIEEERIEKLRVLFPSQGGGVGPDLESPAELIYENRGRDLAFLKVEADRPALELCEDCGFRKGQSVIVIGNPGIGGALTLRNAVNQGIVSTEVEIENQHYYQLGLSINAGNSGGPVIDDQGRVIGVATLKAAEEEGLAFCIPADDVAERLTAVLRQNPETTASFQAQHRLRATSVGLIQTGRLYAAALAEVLQEPDPPSVQEARKRWNDRFNQLGVDALDDLRASLMEIDQNPRADRELSERLSKLYLSVVELRRAWTNVDRRGRLEGEQLGATLVTFLRTANRVAVRLGMAPPESTAQLERFLNTLPRDARADLDAGLDRDRRLRERVTGGMRDQAPTEPTEKAGLLTVLLFRRRVSRVYGTVRVHGSVRNDGPAPLTGVHALVRGVAGPNRAKTAKAKLLPETIAPGEIARFHVSDGVFSPQDRLKLVFVRADGSIIRHQSVSDLEEEDEEDEKEDEP